MIADPFASRIEDLPEILPVFPLSQAILLPGGRLPLNVFEPRYLALLDEALAGRRLMGVIQPLSRDESDKATLYGVGSVGRVVHFSETDARQMFVVLAGLCRFRSVAEVEPKNGFRRLKVDYAPYRADFSTPETPGPRERIMPALKAFIEAHAIELDLRALDALPLGSLVVTLAMALPFEPPEKQALLEARTAADRFNTLCALMEMGAIAGSAGETPQ